VQARFVFFSVLIFGITFVPGVHAESHPAWWTYSSPDATALVGVNWETLRESPFADAIGTEFSSGGSLNFPDLACLKQARQIVLSSPGFLAVVWGSFGPQVVKADAESLKFQPAAYKGMALWLAPDPAMLSLAQLSEELLLVGTRKTLESAIDNSLLEKQRRVSPLLARAARFSQKADLWVVASRLPDPLASIFVPIEAQAKGFEGSVALRGGLNLEASLDAGSYDAAVALGTEIRNSAPSLPAIAQNLKVGVEENKVMLWLRLTSAELRAGLRPAPAAQEGSAPSPAPSLAIQPPPAPAAAPAPQPQVIRILGLEDGPREIPFPQR